MSIGYRHDDPGEPRAPVIILCTTTAHLFDPLAGTSKECTVTSAVRLMGASRIDAALSIWRVIRANFARDSRGQWRAASGAARRLSASPEVERTNAAD